MTEELPSSANDSVEADTGATSGIPEPGADSLSWSDTGQMFIASPTERKKPFVGLMFWIMTAATLALFLLYPYIDTFIEYPPYSKPVIAQLYLIFPVGTFIIAFVTGLFERHGYLIAAVAAIALIAHNLIFDMFFWDQTLIFAAAYLIIAVTAWGLGQVVAILRTEKRTKNS